MQIKPIYEVNQNCGSTEFLIYSCCSFKGKGKTVSFEYLNSHTNWINNCDRQFDNQLLQAHG